MVSVVVIMMVIIVIFLGYFDFSNTHDVRVFSGKCRIVAWGLDRTWPEALMLR